LKVLFDKAATDIVTFINDTLTDEVDLLPTDDTVLTRTNTDVYTPTTNYHPATKKYVDDTTAGVVLGQIPDGTITEVKLDATVVFEIDGKALFKNGTGTFPTDVTYTVTDAFITANTQVIVSPTQEKQGAWSVTSTTGSFTITSDTTETSTVTFDWGATK
jgi:hypothetical protein